MACDSLNPSFPLGLELASIIPTFLSVGNRIPTSSTFLFVTPNKVWNFEASSLGFCSSGLIGYKELEKVIEGYHVGREMIYPLDYLWSDVIHERGGFPSS